MPGVVEAQQGGKWGWGGGNGEKERGDEGREVTLWCLFLCLSPHLNVAPLWQGLDLPSRSL